MNRPSTSESDSPGVVEGVERGLRAELHAGLVGDAPYLVRLVHTDDSGFSRKVSH